MKKKWILPIFIVLIVGFLLTGCSHTKYFNINRVSIKAKINADGSMKVQELFNYTFHGTYHGTTRTINSKVNGFKAYLVSSNSTDSYNLSSATPLKVKKNDNEYKIYTKSVNESKRVLYTYTVPQVVTKYQDAAFIHYRFFDSSNASTLHHVNIRYQFPKQFTNKVHGYLYDYTRQALLDRGTSSFNYTINTLPAGQTTEVHFLLPASDFPQKAIDHERNQYNKILKKEQGNHERFIERKQRLQAIKPLLLWIGLIIWLIAISLIVFRLKRRGQHYNQVNEDELATFDPLYTHYLDHGLSFSNDAITAGLLSLVNKHVIRIERAPIDQKYKEDDSFPDETLRFIINEHTISLSPSEQFFISWLFTEQTDSGVKDFKLDAIYGPTKEEKKDKDTLKNYQLQGQEFRKQFGIWKKKLRSEKHYQRKQYKYPMRLFPWIAFVLIIGLAVGINELYVIDVMSQASRWVVDGLLGAIFLVAYRVLPRWKLGFYLYTLAVFISLMVIHDSASKLLGTVVLLGVATLFIVIPSEKWYKDKLQERLMIKEWKREVKRQKSHTSVDRNHLERLLSLAVVLKVTKPFIMTYQGDPLFKEMERTTPLLQDSLSTHSSFQSALFVSTYAATSSGAGGGGAAGGGGGAGAF